ncbi:uncharacterized protein LOC108035824 isoform X2 [Drosophila biarmipes]|uniref:uncharacterized protein LOC108035824 isoform X2 n=1 Tax=Drosophila biarmipes TaxID=125945 RepID=UPI0007E5F8DC|nr:uncharacterized protein LOC108035824 isoform X2 [Drosophila biarmipes]
MLKLLKNLYKADPNILMCCKNISHLYVLWQKYTSQSVEMSYVMASFNVPLQVVRMSPAEQLRLVGGSDAYQLAASTGGGGGSSRGGGSGGDAAGGGDAKLNDKYAMALAHFLDFQFLCFFLPMLQFSRMTSGS